MQQDICDYSADEQQTKSPIPVLRGFLDRVGTSVGGNVGVEAMSQLVKDLGSALRKMKEKDVAFVKAAEKALIAMANSTVPLSSDGMKLVIENVTSGKLTVKHAAHNLLLHSGTETELVRIIFIFSSFSVYQCRKIIIFISFF